MSELLQAGGHILLYFIICATSALVAHALVACLCWGWLGDKLLALALATVLLLPGSPAAATLDTLGSVIVALYLLWCGVKTLRESASAA